jgi:long-chain acyl-CoA synthetase
MTQEAPDTFPRRLLHNAQAYGAVTAMREKDLGIWQTWTWRQVADEVRLLACGLAAQGFKRGMHLAIIGDNRPCLYWSVAAAQALGGIPVPMYQDAQASELAYVLNDATIVYVVAEDQEQVDKLIEALPQVPSMKSIYFYDPRGLRKYEWIHSLDELREVGREFDRENPTYFAAEVAKGRSDDLAIILYTSGTTGAPKGVCLTHSGFIMAAAGACKFDHLGPRDRVLSYLPMAWVGDHLFSYAEWIMAGFSINCPESGHTAMIDMQEIGPTYYFAPPRIFENLRTQVMIRMEDASALKRWMFYSCLAVAERCGAEILARRRVPLADRIKYWFANILIYAPLRDALGLSRIRVAYTAGAAIGPDLFRFYRSIGVNLKQLYASTETSAYICLQDDDDVRFDTVGKPAPGVDLKIDENSEVVVGGPMLMKGYYKRPDATAESIDRDGYFHTGDAGILGRDGHLKIIDRAKDIGKLANGSLFAPNYVENKLKFFPYIKEAVAFGNHREMVCAFINIDLGAVGNWAERRRLAYSGYTDLAQKPEVYALVRECVEKVNVELSRDPVLHSLQVNRFLVLHKELDPDDEELTRTRKVRRRFVENKYPMLIDAFYAGRTVQHVETLVRFEDGRTGMVAADLVIADAKTFTPVVADHAA